VASNFARFEFSCFLQRAGILREKVCKTRITDLDLSATPLTNGCCNDDMIQLGPLRSQFVQISDEHFEHLLLQYFPHQWRSQRGGTGGPGPPRNAHQKNSKVPADMSCGLDTVAGKMIFSYPPSYSSVRTPAVGCFFHRSISCCSCS